MISDKNTLFVRIKWIHQDEFIVTIPDDEGKLTHTRAATIYEEYLSFVQEAILARIINT